MSEPILPRYRWTICALLFAATTINYLDRQILSLLKPILDDQLHWTNEQFGWINSLFQFAYAGSYLFFGWFVDRYGTKIGYAVSIALWSLAAALHALASTVGGFGLARIALGLGEGGNFPAAIKSVAEWFPQKERPLATTLFNSGANVGALLAPAIIPPMAIAFGWQSAFIAAGVLGFIWLAFWLLLFKPGSIEAPPAAAIASAAETAAEQPFRLWQRRTWAYLLARFLTDPVWWFFLIWLPDYFNKARGMDLKTMGLPLVLIYALVTVLSITGGYLARLLVDRGWSINRTRKVSLLLFAVGVLPVMLAPGAPLWVAVLLIGLAGGSHQAWSATLYSTVGDGFPRSTIGRVVGLGGLAGSVGGMIFPIVCGVVLDRLGGPGYGVLFVYCGSAYLLAFGLNHLLSPKFEGAV